MNEQYIALHGILVHFYAGARLAFTKCEIFLLTIDQGVLRLECSYGLLTIVTIGSVVAGITVAGITSGCGLACSMVTVHSVAEVNS